MIKQQEERTRGRGNKRKAAAATEVEVVAAVPGMAGVSRLASKLASTITSTSGQTYDVLEAHDSVKKHADPLHDMSTALHSAKQAEVLQKARMSGQEPSDPEERRRK